MWEKKMGDRKMKTENHFCEILLFYVFIFFSHIFLSIKTVNSG
jgi:hypothetical protein